MDGLDLVKMASGQPAPHGSAMEIVLKPGNDLICQATGGTSAHDEQNAKVICAPTKAGGMLRKELPVVIISWMIGFSAISGQFYIDRVA